MSAPMVTVQLDARALAGLLIVGALFGWRWLSGLLDEIDEALT